MDKQTFGLYVFVVSVTAANVYLWLGAVQGGPAPRSGRIMGLIIMLGIGALFSEKFSRNQFAPAFIRAGCLIGLTLMFFMLYNRGH